MIPQSDDQFYLFDWQIRHGIQPNVSRVAVGETNTSGTKPWVTTIDGHKPFDLALHEKVKELKS